MSAQSTLVLVKPDGVRRGLTGQILARIEAKGYVVTDLRMVQPDPALLADHYAEHADKPFFTPLQDFMLSGPIVAARVEGEGVIAGVRSLLGATNPTEAAPGTIRGDFGREWGTEVLQNLVHGSDSDTSAAAELALWFD